MTKPNILEENSLNMIVVRKTLEKIKKRDTELNFRMQKTEEYLQNVTKLSNKDYETLLKELEGLNVPRFKEIHLNKIVDLLPKTPELVKLLFQGQTISISDDNAKKIANVVEKYV
ncbi:hypothetical protein HYY69_00255 [Candidatus Woesearchaeota archaeon]|nr:hypothetical protein [Candidatus Woesearchaeota archaeon]